MPPINGFFVYSYEHDDDLSGWTAIDVFKGPSFRLDPLNPPDDPESDKEGPLPPDYIEKLVIARKDCGWAGDGRLGAMIGSPIFF
jgi:hypothetical protein